MKLILKATGEELKPGMAATTFRGEAVTLVSFQAPPKNTNSTGRVYCTDANGCRSGWYPGVIGAEFVAEVIELPKVKVSK